MNGVVFKLICGTKLIYTDSPDFNHINGRVKTPCETIILKLFSNYKNIPELIYDLVFYFLKNLKTVTANSFPVPGFHPRILWTPIKS